MKKLSVCIPTYNRVNELSSLIESIIDCMNDLIDYEICVSDNNSNDGTDKLFEKKFNLKNIKYNKLNNNYGPDVNYISAYSMATGKYIWMIGSDDLLSNSLETRELIAKLVYNEHDLLVSNRYNADHNLRVYNTTNWFKWEDGVYTISSYKDLVDYVNSINSLGGLFSYLSSFIFKRELWNIEYSFKFIGTHYNHVAAILKSMESKSRLSIYIQNKPIIICRHANDSFFQNRIDRIYLDYKGYMRLTDIIQDENFTNSIKELLTREHSIIQLNEMGIISALDDTEISIINSIYGINLEPNGTLQKFYKRLVIHAKSYKYLLAKKLRQK